MQNRFGIIVNDAKELKQILGSPELISALNQSTASSQQEIQRAMSMYDGYSHRDDYGNYLSEKS